MILFIDKNTDYQLIQLYNSLKDIDYVNTLLIKVYYYSLYYLNTYISFINKKSLIGK